LTVLTDPTVPQKQKTFRLRWAPRTNATHKGESMTHEESEAVKLTERLVRAAHHPAVALIQRGHKIVSQGCNLFRCCRCGEHFDSRGDWSVYCQPKDTK
jgi:hypothetical protein